MSIAALALTESPPRPGPSPSLDQHPEREKILAALTNGSSLRAVQRRFQVPYETLRRYAHRMIPAVPSAPSPQLLVHRAAMMGFGDPTLSAYPLGVLFGRRLIDIEQHNAGCHYAWLYAAVLRVPTGPTVCRLDGSRGGYDDAPEGAQERRQRVFQSLTVAALVRDIAVFGVFPRFLSSTRWKPAEFSALLTVQHGLVALDHALRRAYTKER